MILILWPLCWPRIRESRGRGTHWAHMPAFVTLLVVAILGSYLISRTNMRVIQADIVYKRAKPFDDQAARTRDPQLWDSAIAIYEHAINLAPKKIFITFSWGGPIWKNRP
jgi:hypothetical protein